NCHHSGTRKKYRSGRAGIEDTGMNFITRKQLSRRHLLRGAGTVMALPLLESMVPALAAQPLAAPRSRLACIYIAHGAVMKYWTPSGDGSGFEFSPTLKSL